MSIWREWDIQASKNWWLSLGIHIDHKDPSITLHLPAVVICFGRCKMPGLEWSLWRWVKYGRVERAQTEADAIGYLIHALVKKYAKLVGGKVVDKRSGKSDIGWEYRYLGVMTDGRFEPKNQFVINCNGWAMWDGRFVNREGSSLVQDLTGIPDYELFHFFAE